MSNPAVPPLQLNDATVPGDDPAAQLKGLWRQGLRPDVAEFLARLGSLKPVQIAAVLGVDQEQRWQIGERIPAEAYLQRHPAIGADPEAMLDLIYREYLLRERLGECPELAEYQTRFPDHADRLRTQIELHHALANDAVPSMSLSGGLVDTEVSNRAAPPLPARELVPGYEVLGELGRGGMGVVYKAWHLALNRMVALKMIKAGVLADAHDLRRFRQEAEASARLQHPNVVQIYEVGVTAGLPYFALEYVDGGCLAQKLRGKPQPGGESARLVETLARAMHYAHQRGIVHRDLKPGNILLASGEGYGGGKPPLREPPVSQTTGGSRPPLAGVVPKITDFGLAKHLYRSHPQTQTGIVMGTPSYMAPEQASGQTKCIGPAMDTYALGAILYELLTGRPPFQGETALETIEQVLLEDPVPPRQLQPKVARDLETICLKCLRKEPHKRYASAEELAEDLRRFQAGEPITARPVGRMERVVKWARRRPATAALVGVSVAAVAVVVATLATATVLLAAANVRERQAAEQARLALLVARENEKEAEKQRDLARQGFQNARKAVFLMLTRVAGSHLRHVPQMQPVRKQLLEDALKFHQGFLAEQGSDPEVQIETAQAYRYVGDIYLQLGEHDKAEATYRKGLDLQEQLVSRFPERADYRWKLAASHNNLGALLGKIGRHAQAEAAHRQAVDLERQLMKEDPANPNYPLELAYSYNNLADLLQATGKEQQAEETFALAQELASRLTKEFPARPDSWAVLARSHLNRGAYCQRKGRMEEADQGYRRALELYQKLTKDLPERSDYWNSLGSAHHHLGMLHYARNQFVEAERSHRQALEIRQRLANDFPTEPLYRLHLAMTHNKMGMVLCATKRHADGLEWYRRGLDVSQKLTKDFPDSPEYRFELATSHGNLGVLLQSLRKNKEAEDAYRLAADLMKQLAKEFPLILDYRSHAGGMLDNVAEMLRLRGEYADARKLLEEAIGCQLAVLKVKPRYPMASNLLSNHYYRLADTLLHLGQHGEAARAAGLLPGALPGRWRDHHEAIQFLARCVTLAEKDDELSQEKRTDAARGYGSQAARILREALDKGIADAKQVDKDATLDPLRSHEDFRQVLTDLAAKGKTSGPS